MEIDEIGSFLRHTLLPGRSSFDLQNRAAMFPPHPQPTQHLAYDDPLISWVWEPCRWRLRMPRKYVITHNPPQGTGGGEGFKLKPKNVASCLLSSFLVVLVYPARAANRSWNAVLHLFCAGLCTGHPSVPGPQGSGQAAGLPGPRAARGSGCLKPYPTPLSFPLPLILQPLPLFSPVPTSPQVELLLSPAGIGEEGGWFRSPPPIPAHKPPLPIES